jgi:diaminohydroxyphosphoribosylaminopyrimidine deaminase/5-amino-6-(5-phosphoribosylamino)uracil reductase
VGTNTALYDDPELTTRLWPGAHPVRFVVDKILRLPASLKLLNGEQQTIVFNYLRHETHPNLLYYKLYEEGNLIPQLVDAFYKLKIQSVLVEGGAQLLQSFIDAGLWDEAVVITNQELALPGGIAAPQLQRQRLIDVASIFSDVVHTYANGRNTLL